MSKIQKETYMYLTKKNKLYNKHELKDVIGGIRYDTKL
jgi:hypothetical protein